MKDGTRFELKLSPTQRALLDELSRETGMSVADLCRLGTGWVLAHRQMLIAGPPVLARGERRPA